MIRDTVVVSLAVWALIATVLCILGFSRHRRGVPRVWFGELVVSWLYAFASIAVGFAEGADDFLTKYREVRAQPRVIRAVRSTSVVRGEA